MFTLEDFHNTGIDLTLAMSLLANCRKHEATRVIKTWVNSWATSSRFHEPIIYPCLLGCQDGVDRLSHYVQCPFMLHLQIKILTNPPSPLPLTRIGLVDPSRDSLLSVACCFAGYHAVKRKVSSSLSSSGPLPVHTISDHHQTFADAYIVAANECGLPTRAIFTVACEL